MTRQEVFFDRIEGDGETHFAAVECRGAGRLTFSVDYEFEPENEGFFEEHPEFEGEETCFYISAEGRIGRGGKFFPVAIKGLNGGAVIREIEKKRGLYSVDVNGLDEVRLVLETQPPTSFPTFVTVVGNLK